MDIGMMKWVETDEYLKGEDDSLEIKDGRIRSRQSILAVREGVKKYNVNFLRLVFS